MKKSIINQKCLERPKYRSFCQYLKELAKRPTHLSTEEQKQYDEIWNRHTEDDF